MSAAHLIRFEDVAPGMPYHAALVLSPPFRSDFLHTHDFAEAFYVLGGAGLHMFNGESHALHAGDLVWVRPEDLHMLTARRGSFLHFINIAFPKAAWHAWQQVAGLECWKEKQMSVAAERRGEAAALFERALRAFQQGPSRLDICRFWGDVLDLCESGMPAEENALDGPLWLTRACAVMGNGDNLRVGVPRFVDLAGTSAAHLARVLKATDGRTPTAWVRERRLRRAERLLLTTAQEIGDIADECGFDNLSYFYRCFKKHTGKTPRAFRLEACRRVLLS